MPAAGAGVIGGGAFHQCGDAFLISECFFQRIILDAALQVDLADFDGVAGFVEDAGNARGLAVHRAGPELIAAFFQVVNHRGGRGW